MKLYHQFFLKLFDEKRFVNLVNVFLASKRSMNPMKKYPHIVESYACILKIFVVIDKERSINALISFEIYSTPKASKYVTSLLSTHRATDLFPISEYSSRFFM